MLKAVYIVIGGERESEGEFTPLGRREAIGSDLRTFLVPVHIFKAKGPDRRRLCDVLPDFAQWKCAVSPGNTTTLPGGKAVTLAASNLSPRPI